MNGNDPRHAELDARLRRLLGGIDTSPGFEARVMQRVAMLATASVVPREDLRAHFERRRKLLRRRLRREAWMNGIAIMGLGACASALLWRYAPEIERLATSSALSVDPGLLIVGTLAAVGATVWLMMKRAHVASG